MMNFDKIKKSVARMNISKRLKKHGDCNSDFPVFNICSNPILSDVLCSELIRKLLESAEKDNEELAAG